MISTERPPTASRGQLLTAGLPLVDNMPLQMPVLAETSARQEGPLALDYRTSGIDLKMGMVAVAHDVTYTATYKEYYYDSKKYYRWIAADKVDDK